MSQQIDWIRKMSNGSALRFWNLIEQTFRQIDSETNQTQCQFPCLSKIFRAAHSFAPSSANVEQCFSVLKLLKSNIRNSLKEETLESLILIHEEFKDEKPIKITDRLLMLYDEMKQKMNENKSRPRSSQIQEEAKLDPSQISQANLEEEVKVDRNNLEESLITNNRHDEEVDSISRILEESLNMEIEEEAKSRSKEKKIRPYEDILIFPEDIKDPKVTHQKKYIRLSPN